MAHAEPIFRRSSIFSGNIMPQTDYCNSFAFLPDRPLLDLGTLRNWKGHPDLHHGSTPDFDINLVGAKDPRGYGAIGSGRPKPGGPGHPDLHHGSTPDFDINFDNAKGPRGYGAIGSGRPKPSVFVFRGNVPKTKSLKLTDILPRRCDASRPRIFGERFPSFRALRLTSARFIRRPEDFKFAEFFPSDEPHGESATFDSSNDDVSTLQLEAKSDYNLKTPISSPDFKIVVHRRRWRGEPSPNGLPFRNYYGVLTPEDEIAPITLDSEDDDASTPSEPTFDLEAQDTPLSTAERTANCGAGPCEAYNRHYSFMKRTIPDFGHMLLASPIGELRDMMTRTSERVDKGTCGRCGRVSQSCSDSSLFDRR